MEQEVLPLGFGLDFVEDEGQVGLQVAQADVAERVGGGRLDLPVGVVKALENYVLQAGVLAQVAELKARKSD